MATFQVRAGDTNTALEVQLTRRDGTLQPLNGTETGSFVLRSWDGVDVVTRAMTISDATNSKVKVTLLAADTSALAGRTLRVRIPVTFGGGVETFPTSPDDLLVAVC